VTGLSLSIVTPVIRAGTLRRMLSQLAPQLTPRDEVLIVGDGPQPECRKVVESFGLDNLRYWDMIPAPRNWGNPQRNEAIGKARGTHLVFIDDDDQVDPKGLETIRSAVSLAPGHPHMFRMLYQGRPIWSSPDVLCGNVSGQMFVPPNVSGRLGTWNRDYAADFNFIRTTLMLYPEGYGAVVWREEMPIVQGLAGQDSPEAIASRTP